MTDSVQAHTKGPWIWDKDFNGLYGAGPDNVVLSYASYEGMWLAYSEHRQANARLISAAPDLLAALTMVRDADEECIRDHLTRMPPTARAIIDAAIAKALGATS